MATRAKVFVGPEQPSSPERSGGGLRPRNPTSDWYELSTTAGLDPADIGEKQRYNGDAPAPRPRDMEEQGAQEESDSGSSRRVLLSVKAFIGVLLFVFVLVCLVLSKVTLVSMTDRLRNHTWKIAESHSADAGGDLRWQRSEAAVLYWQLLFVMVLPSCVTFLRAFFFGVFGKTRRTFPWPTFRAGVMVSACRMFPYRYVHAFGLVLHLW